MNNKSIQILRGSINYDPSNINQELLDGQPFYSKKNKQLYVGDKTKDITSPVGAANLVPSEGRHSTKTQTECETFDFDPEKSNNNTISKLESNNFKVVKNESNEILSNVYGSYSQSLGYANQVNRGSSLAVGYRNLITGNVDSPGNYGYAFGNANFVSGVASSSFGLHNCIDAEASFTFGQLNSILNTATSGEGRHIAIGNNHTITGGQNNAAFGNGQKISGDYNAAFGYQNEVSNAYNTVFGANNNNSGQYSTISGRNNECTTNDSFVVGNGNKVYSPLNMVSGKQNKSFGEGNFITGRENQVKSSYSSVHGVSNEVGFYTGFSYCLINGSSNTSTNSYQIINGLNNESNKAFTFTCGQDNVNNNDTTFMYGLGLKAINNGGSWGYRRAIFGQYNNENSHAQFQFGMGSKDEVTGTITQKNILDLFDDGTLSVRSLQLTDTHTDAKIQDNNMLYVDGDGYIKGQLKVETVPATSNSVVRRKELDNATYADIYDGNEIYLNLNHKGSKEFISTNGGQTIQGSLACNELSTKILKINGSILTFTSIEGLY